MSLPGIGSVVIYHMTHGTGTIDVPAFVVCTRDAWVANPEFASAYVEPAADEVILAAFTSASGIGQETATEGTGAGQFSRISLVLGLGTIDLGSVDLSNTTATNVTVPDV
jgi:hypothetical protein